ncbi:hypothetical protein DFH06DRAFT_1336582 [Mycena polygramma]|nr:hypothetical protein DFH06DRAFT_1336582 [Mycena polygramma]
MTSSQSAVTAIGTSAPNISAIASPMLIGFLLNFMLYRTLLVQVYLSLLPNLMRGWGILVAVQQAES